MTEATTQRAKPQRPAPGIEGFDTTRSEMPKFDIPKFDLPKFEVPAAFREFAEKGVAQAKETYEKMKSAAEETTEVLEECYANATKGGTEYNLKLLDAARTNANATFDLATQLLGVKSLSEMVELTSAHARKQFDTFANQTKELTAIAQKVVAESAEPLKTGVNKALRASA
jgi:phasin